MAKSVTVRVPSNIALIKYWGKRDEDLILPLNDSLSLTIDSLYAETRVTSSAGSSESDSVSINGKPVDLTKSKRFARCFNEARRLVRKMRREDSGDANPCYSFQVESTTNFPVAAGLASSAAGFAAIAFALGQLFEFEPAEVSRIARIGSGSACRSVFGGLVHWEAGSDPAGLDCFSKCIFPATHWPELRAVIVVLNESEKEIGSTVGMRATVETSSLMKYRVEHVVPERVKSLTSAFEQRDFSALASIIMADSNTFHAVCMDTSPPLRYMNDDSWSIVQLVNSFNADSTRAAYSFDAGPNACVFILEEHLADFVTQLCEKFTVAPTVLATVNESLTGQAEIRERKNEGDRNIIQNLIISKVGGEPTVMKK